MSIHIGHGHSTLSSNWERKTGKAQPLLFMSSVGTDFMFGGGVKGGSSRFSQYFTGLKNRICTRTGLSIPPTFAAKDGRTVYLEALVGALGVDEKHYEGFASCMGNTRKVRHTVVWACRGGAWAGDCGCGRKVWQGCAG